MLFAHDESASRYTAHKVRRSVRNGLPVYPQIWKKDQTITHSRTLKPILHCAFFGGVGADNATLFALGRFQTDLWPTSEYIFEKENT